MDKKIAKILVGLPLEGPFDYRIPAKVARDIQIGCRVWVQFGFRKLVGYVVGFSSSSKFKKVKPVISLIDCQPVLGTDMLKLTKDFAEYYCCTWSEAIEASLPEGLRKGRAVSALIKDIETAPNKNQFSGIIIHDFFQYKYWDLIIERIKDVLKENRNILFLVPDAATLKNREELIRKSFPVNPVRNKFSNGADGGFKPPSVLSGNDHRFKSVAFSNGVNITVLERKKGVKAQLEEWQKIKNGQADIVLGTRSAIFAPLTNLGLIIVEDEDNSAYKQEQGPFYHAREVAIMRSRQERIQLILTSQTPSLEAMHLIKSLKFKLIKLEPETALSKTQIVDLSRYHRKKDRAAIFSLPLLDSLQQAVNKDEKVILFINRKGFSTFLHCKKCGFSLKCPRCNVGLTFHYDQHKLVCRYCQYKTEPIELCPQCNSDYIRYFGMGTERIESEVHRLFPQKKILRLDSEKKIRPDNFDILIATQMIFKSPESIRADLVAALQIDTALNRLDFRAAEKTFSFLVRLLKTAKQRFIIQTHNAEHYAIQAARQADFASFYKQEMKFRRSLGFPPFCHFVSVGLRGRSEDRVKAIAILFAESLMKYKPKAVFIFESQPDIPAKLRGNYRWHILLKGKNIKAINQLIRKGIKKIKKKSGIIISVNVDA